MKRKINLCILGRHDIRQKFESIIYNPNCYIINSAGKSHQIPKEIRSQCDIAVLCVKKNGRITAIIADNWTVRSASLKTFNKKLIDLVMNVVSYKVRAEHNAKLVRQMDHNPQFKKYLDEFLDYAETLFGKAASELSEYYELQSYVWKLKWTRNLSDACIGTTCIRDFIIQFNLPYFKGLVGQDFLKVERSSGLTAKQELMKCFCHELAHALTPFQEHNIKWKNEYMRLLKRNLKGKSLIKFG